MTALGRGWTYMERQEGNGGFYKGEDVALGSLKPTEEKLWDSSSPPPQPPPQKREQIYTSNGCILTVLET